MSNVKITIIDNGPFRVEGAQNIEMVWPDGTRAEMTKDIVFLCRCGASANKPFCDGKHSKTGFQAAAQAVPESAE